jgi:PadR family transcriptional regulator, regulatory protein PadR
MQPPRRQRRESGLTASLVHLHLLHHAGEAPIFGLEMIEELARHGYSLSAGTMYPILHRLEDDGLLRSKNVLARDGRRRRMYRLTPAGRRALRTAKQKVRELFGELFEHY